MVKNYKQGLTKEEKEYFDYLVDLHGGDTVDKSKVRKRILALRKRKSNKTTARDMEDMFGY
jgi:hypothetical protein